MPLFDSASSTVKTEATAVISITPGMFNNLFVNDVVLVAFEENALEKPVILGKLFTGTNNENNTKGGAGVLGTLLVRDGAKLPGPTTQYVFADPLAYKYLDTPKKQADYIKWLEQLVKQLATELDANFQCLKNWTQFQLEAKNVEVDDGDLADEGKLYNNTDKIAPFMYQEENNVCKVCSVKTCSKRQKRTYTKPSIDSTYSDKGVV